MLRSLPTSPDGRYDDQVRPPTEHVDPNANHSKLYGLVQQLEEDERFGPIIDDPKIIVSIGSDGMNVAPY